MANLCKLILTEIPEKMATPITVYLWLNQVCAL